jgi:1-phosphofructokinase
VSAPIEVVTVTPNPAIDWTLTVPGFAAGAVNRVEAQHSRPGGKGVNVAAALADAGHHVAATGWLGEGNAAPFEAFFAAKGIEDRFVRVAGETRVGIKIADPSGQRTTDVNFPGQTPSSADRGALMERVLKAEPQILKPTIHELEALVGARLATRGDVVAAARGLLEGETELVVVSMGSEGALFVAGDRVVAATPPAVAVRTTAGAGDAMVAGIVAGRLRGLELGELARLASAFALEAVTGEAARGWFGKVTLEDVA